MNKQEIFNKVATHLIKQNKKSYLPSGSNNLGTVCAYRGKNDCKCGIGILIPDNKYSFYLEGMTISNASVLSALEDGINTEDEETIGFLSALQGVHDFYVVEQWKEKLIFVAKDYSLSFEVVE